MDHAVPKATNSSGAHSLEKATLPAVDSSCLSIFNPSRLMQLARRAERGGKSGQAADFYKRVLEGTSGTSEQRTEAFQKVFSFLTTLSSVHEGRHLRFLVEEEWKRIAALDSRSVSLGVFLPRLESVLLPHEPVLLERRLGWLASCQVHDAAPVGESLARFGGFVLFGSKGPLDVPGLALEKTLNQWIARRLEEKDLGCLPVLLSYLIVQRLVLRAARADWGGVSADYIAVQDREVFLEDRQDIVATAEVFGAASLGSEHYYEFAKMFLAKARKRAATLSESSSEGASRRRRSQEQERLRVSENAGNQAPCPQPRRDFSADLSAGDLSAEASAVGLGSSLARLDPGRVLCAALTLARLRDHHRASQLLSGVKDFFLA